MKVLHRIISSSKPRDGGGCNKKRGKLFKSRKRCSTSIVDSDEMFDISARTADVDISDRSAALSPYQFAPPVPQQAKVIGDTTPLNGRQLVSCLKVPTQRESLAQIGQQSKLSMPNIMEAAIDSSGDDSRYSDLGIASSSSTVQFGTIAFREYNVELSDNPSISNGVAIGLGWRYDPNQDIKVNVDDYESIISLHQSRRNKYQLVLPLHIREDILKSAGYSRHEISCAKIQARKDKNRRIASVQLKKYDPIAEIVDMIKHGIRRRITHRDS